MTTSHAKARSGDCSRWRPYLQRLIIAALDSGMRRGELLALRWGAVNLRRRELTVRAETTKTDKTRHVPISARLAGVLAMARTALETMLSTTEAARLTDQERAALAPSTCLP